MITGSIVIYHSDEKTVLRAVESFAPSADRRLYIVDNGEEETDRYRSFSYVEYLFSGKNEGYGKAHNRAIRKAAEAGSTYHVVLNPDVAFAPDVLDALRKYADSHPDVVYILPKVVYPDGELQYLCKLLPTPADLIFRRFLPASLVRKSNDRYCLKMSGYDRIINPPCLSGCFMFMRTSALIEHDIFFDDRFFMYCEDFDLIRRLHRIGKTVFYPEVQIVHDHAHESYRNLRMLGIHIVSAVKYFGKYGWFFDAERREMNRKILREIREGREAAE